MTGEKMCRRFQTEELNDKIDMYKNAEQVCDLSFGLIWKEEKVYGTSWHCRT